MGTNVLDPRLTEGSNNPCTVNSFGSWGPPAYNLPTMYDSGYFWIHHSAADTVERLDPRQLNHHAAALAVWAYAVAQLPELLPRNESAPPAVPASPAASARGAMLGAGIGGGVGALLGAVALVVAARRYGWCSSKGGSSKDPQYRAVPSV